MIFKCDYNNSGNRLKLLCIVVVDLSNPSGSFLIKCLV